MSSSNTLKLKNNKLNGYTDMEIGDDHLYKGLGIILPAEGQELEINKKNILNCLISASGNVLLGGEPVEMKDLSRRVKEEIRANDKLIISVKAHEKAEYDVYVEVLDQLKLANATRISIAETE